MSIQYGERLSATRSRREGRGSAEETVGQAIDRLSGSRAMPWAKAPEGSGTESKMEAMGSEAPPGPQEKPAWMGPIEKKLAEKGTVEFKDTRFSEAKDYLEAALGCSVVVDRRLRERVMGLPVSLKAKDMPFEQILKWVVENDLGLKYALVDGAVYVSDADGMTEKIGVTVAYDVEDLLYASSMPDFAGPMLGLPVEDSGRRVGIRFNAADAGDSEPRRHAMTPERLLRIISRAVEPGTWKDEDK